MRALTLIERAGVLQRISYADLGVEELGSIYESLLDFTPRVTTEPEDVDGREVPANTFFLDPRGLERKSTGSYYTHPSLVNELIRSALLPVMRDRLAGAGLPVVADTDPATDGPATDISTGTSTQLSTGLLTDYAALADDQRQAGEDALLGITVCDPAAGSGHFLVKANNVLGAELARLRTGDDYPSESAVQAAKRDVLAECIYAVDLNPMAVELCRVSLWINASVADRPLNFLKHHIKPGNSLIGATPELLEDGVPYDAFALGRPGDDRELAKAFRKQNRQERRDYEKSGTYQMTLPAHVLTDARAAYRTLNEITELAPSDPKLARERYMEYLTSDAHRVQKLEADFWTAAFFWSMPEGADWAPTFGEFTRLRHEGPEALPAERLAQISALADEYRFFHWHLEFSEVFDHEEDATPAAEPTLSRPSTVSHPSRSGFDVVLGNPPWDGRVGIVVQSGIATDYYSRAFFADLVNTKQLVSFYDFENREGLFPDMHRTHPHFYLLTLTGRNRPAHAIDLAFWCTNVDHLADKDRRYTLAPEDFALINPNTQNMPVFRRRQDAELTKAIYGRAPILIKEIRDDNGEVVEVISPWDCEITRTFDMARFSEQAKTFSELESFGCKPRQSGRAICDNEEWIPVLESKTFWQFDHRYATYEGVEQKEAVKGYCRTVTTEEKVSPDTTVIARYWLRRSVVDKYTEWHTHPYWLGYRDITNTTNERTMIPTILPRHSSDYTVRLIFGGQVKGNNAASLLANLASFCFDYVARQSIGGTHFSDYIMKQLPVIPPDRYTHDLLAYIVPRVLELTYTAWDIKAFADDVWREATEQGGRGHMRQLKRSPGKNGRRPI